MVKDELMITSWCSIRRNRVTFNDKIEFYPEEFINFAAFIKYLYKKEQVNYPKFYKMDNLCKLGFLTAEIVLRNNRITDRYDNTKIGVVIANSSASLDTDHDYQETIRDKSDYFPSPSVFVYTLPNIVIGEICIRHKIKGENAFFIAEKFDASLIVSYVADLMHTARINACLCGWVELMKDNYESALFIVERRVLITERNENPENFKEFNTINLNHCFFYKNG